MSRRSMAFALLATFAAAALACSDKSKAPETAQTGAPSTPAVAKLSAAPDKFVAAGAVRLRYRDGGAATGTPIVFIHGYGRSLEDMLALADSFAPTHRVIAYDVRGFGQSSKSGDVHRYGAAMVDDVIDLLDSLGIPRAHLVGHSMGALIAGATAARHPDRVASATLIAGPFYADSAACARSTTHWTRELEHGGGIRKFLVWLFPGIPDSAARAGSKDAMAHNDSLTMIAALKSFGGLAVTKASAEHATVPVFIAAGGSDPLTPTSRALAQEWPKAKFLELPGLDHVQIFNSPEVMAGMRAIMQ